MARSLLGGFPEAFVNTYLALNQARQAEVAMREQTAREEQRLKMQQQELAQREQQLGLDRQESQARSLTQIFSALGAFGGPAEKPLSADQKADNARLALKDISGEWRRMLDEGVPPKDAAPLLQNYAKQLGYQDYLTPEVLKSLVSGASAGTLAGERVPKGREAVAPGAGMAGLALAAIPGFGVAAPGLMAAQPMIETTTAPIPQAEREALAAGMPTEEYAQKRAQAKALTELAGARTEYVTEQTTALQKLEQQREATGKMQQELTAARIVSMQAKTDTDRAMVRIRSKVAGWQHAIAQERVGLERRRVSVAERNAVSRERKSASTEATYLKSRLGPMEGDLAGMAKERQQLESLRSAAKYVLDTVKPTGVPGADNAYINAKRDWMRAEQGLKSLAEREAGVRQTVDEAKQMLGIASRAAGTTNTDSAGKPLTGGANGMGAQTREVTPEIVQQYSIRYGGDARKIAAALKANGFRSPKKRR